MVKKSKSNSRYFNSKAEMGVGTLVIFISFLLVASVAAMVLIKTMSSLQQKALTTGSQTKDMISSHINIAEISGTEPTADGTINNLTILAKLAAGSEAISLSEVILVVNTDSKSAVLLKYRGTNNTFTLGQTGFNTWRVQDVGYVGNTSNNVTLNEDLDDDGFNDYVSINTTTAIFNLSTAGLIDVHLTSGTFTVGGSSVMTSKIINKTGVTYGFLTVADVGGSMVGDATMAANGTFNVTPFEEGRGYYVVDYLQQGPNYQHGVFNRGDVIKFYVETPNPVGEDYNIKINFFPKVGTATSVGFKTPNVMNTERVYLYP